MIFTKKIDRAFQWAGEKMGAEAKTTHSEEFKMLETEMSLRHDGNTPRAKCSVVTTADVSPFVSRRRKATQISQCLHQMEFATM
jgi:hypothetical protein